MKRICPILFGLAIVIGCSWTPSRDNPVDPRSPVFVTPTVPNRPPVISTVRTITDCEQTYERTFCAFEVTCRIDDPDLNVIFDSLQAQIDTIPLGKLTFNPVLGEFFIRKTQDDLPAGSLFAYARDTVWVRATDDSGSTTRGWTVFQDPLTQPPLAIVHPGGGAGIDTSVRSIHPSLGWILWDGTTANHTFGVTVKYQDVYTVWDTTGLPATDTTAIVTANLLSTSEWGNSTWYSWHVTVTDDRGNRLSSQPGFFYIFTTGGLTDPPKRESYRIGINE
jgi:hypothetical protein